MGRESLVDHLIAELLGDIVAGRLEPGGSLPAEAELAARFDVSRLTIREAMRKLQAQGIVRTVPGRRSELSPVSRWTDIGAALQVAEAQIGRADSSIQLLQLRRMIETGACALAATRMGAADLLRLEHELEAMRAASAVNDVEAFVVHDIAFHDVILDSSGNRFVRTLFDPLQALLKQRRTDTSKVPAVQAHDAGGSRRQEDRIRHPRAAARPRHRRRSGERDGEARRLKDRPAESASRRLPAAIGARPRG